MATNMKGKGEDFAINRIPPLHYLHVLDQNTNVTKMVIGPKTYIRADNEKIVISPVKMMTIPPRHYCVIEDPVSYDDDGEVLFDEFGQAVLLHGDEEIRLAQKPFPLYPGEKVKQNITPLKIVYANTQCKLRANIDFTEEDGSLRIAGDEWMFVGPGTYIPRKEVTVISEMKATVIRPNQALLLRARKSCVDFKGNERVTGEEWLVKDTGAYLPNAYEEVISMIDAHVLTEKKALHMRALKTFVDDFKISRKSGEEWLITLADTDIHIPNVYEEVVGVINITTLTNRQYCVILDPVDENGKPQLGKKKLVKGEKSFFLMPGESLMNGIQDLYVLHEDEALICTAIEAFTDMSKARPSTSNIDDPEKPKRPRLSKKTDEHSPAEGSDEEVSGEGGPGIFRQPGDRWMISGPREYVPPVQVKVLLMNKAIPLDENEGIYVRDIKSGKVRVISGTSYILNENEELWSKELPSAVEDLLGMESDPLAERGLRGKSQEGSKKKRKKTDAVTYRVPHNAAVQIYDYKEKKARVVFGPDLVMLGPDEQFTQLSLSGGKPKKPNVIRSLCLLLGPDFCTDIITVETSDHARLQLQLAYNWHFAVEDKADPKKVAMLFSVPDFVGDACKAIASRIRGAVAGVQFDDFHKNSAKIIRASVFGLDDNTKVKDGFLFPQNNLVITNVDIQSVEPVDQRTRDALQKSVQLAIEITTNSQEASARHEAERLEQEAKGRLERQKISDEAEAERARRELLELQANSAAVESTGQAKAEAQSRAEAARIEGEAAVDQAKLKAEAMKIESVAELERIQQARVAEIKYISEKDALEEKKANVMSQLQIQMFDSMITSIGQQTLRDIAVSGQENQLKLLQSIGLKTTLITDGNTPINLFNTAQGLVGNFVKNNEVTDYQGSTTS